jgi:hypothetical protein
VHLFNPDALVMQLVLQTFNFKSSSLGSQYPFEATKTKDPEFRRLSVRLWPEIIKSPIAFQ